MKNTKPIISMKSISKYFGYVKALDDVNFMTYPNEIIALVGDNGAGKSTLIKVLSGIHKPDKGKIIVKGKEVNISDPMKAKSLGIGTLFQDLKLVDVLNVGKNLFLGKEPTKWKFFVNKNRLYKESEKIIEKLNIKIESPELIAGYLSGGQRQAIAIGRILLEDPEIIILDEPTAALGVAETKKVIELIKDLKTSGATIVIISHQIEEVFSFVDRICVLRQGKLIGYRRVSDTDTSEIVSMITGVIKS